MNNITALIMAAGTDDKMKSKKSKLAQTIYGKEVIKRVVNSVKKAGIEEVGVIVGENKEEIEDKGDNEEIKNNDIDLDDLEELYNHLEEMEKGGETINPT